MYVYLISRRRLRDQVASLPKMSYSKNKKKNTPQKKPPAWAFRVSFDIILSV